MSSNRRGPRGHWGREKSLIIEEERDKIPTKSDRPLDTSRAGYLAEGCQSAPSPGSNDYIDTDSKWGVMFKKNSTKGQLSALQHVSMCARATLNSIWEVWNYGEDFDQRLVLLDKINAVVQQLKDLEQETYDLRKDLTDSEGD